MLKKNFMENEDMVLQLNVLITYMTNLLETMLKF